jgi:hypothetical protein
VYYGCVTFGAAASLPGTSLLTTALPEIISPAANTSRECDPLSSATTTGILRATFPQAWEKVMRHLLALASALLAFIPAAYAHHSLSPYAMEDQRTVEGTVKSFDWSNPHVRINLLVPDVNGGANQWEFEGGSPGRLTSRGFTKDVISLGDKITVAYNPRRDHSIGGFFVAVTSNGKTYTTDRFRAPKS